MGESKRRAVAPPPVRETEREPAYDMLDRPQWILAQMWREAHDARCYHLARDGHGENVEAMLAAHKAGWIKEALRRVRSDIATRFPQREIAPARNECPEPR